MKSTSLVSQYTQSGKRTEAKLPRRPAFSVRALSRALLPLIALAAFLSCGNNSNRLLIWTDRPEFAFYAEYFNAGQDRYKAEVRYFESPAQKLVESGEIPDIVAASWLKSSSTRALFKPLDNLFSGYGLDKSSFYPGLLSLGNIENTQYLLPISFNIPAMIFARNFGRETENPFTIGMNEIKEQGKAYNTVSDGIYTRMGFSLSANQDFLFITASLFGTGFREASPVGWDPQALENAVLWIQEWIAEANTSVQVEDDFNFKYFYEPPDKLLNSGRVLYVCMDSSRFFTLPEERRANLDFRWIAENETIPIDEGSVYYGIHKNTRAAGAARAFTLWFFRAETQRLLLEEARSKRLTEMSFGIAGGFSSMQTVTEQVFPLFYPGLLGRMPPGSFLLPANILPRNWATLKERVILPYLSERIRYTSREEVRTLERRIADWYRLNREQ